MSKFAELSIEVGHLYLRDLAGLDDTDWKERVRNRIVTGLASVAPTIKRYLDHKKSVSIVVMIDDYFAESDTSPGRDAVADAVQEVASDLSDRYDEILRNKYGWKSPLRITYISFESSLALTVDRLYNRIEFPGRWLSNDQHGRSRSSERHEAIIGMSEVENAGRQKSRTRRLHTIHLDVELYSEETSSCNASPRRIWSCPILAAWWQLTRLGLLRDQSGSPSVPEGTIALSLPEGMSGPNSTPSFFAKRTLTVLSPEFLEVEVAVRTILSRVQLIDRERQGLKASDRIPTPSEHLNRIGYVLVPDDLHPHGMEHLHKWF